MLGTPGRWRERIEAMAQRFRERGATSPDRAMTVQELGLPPRFEEAMKRRLGRTGIFVDIGGRYYLDEARLRDFEQRDHGSGSGYGGQRSNFFVLRLVRMTLGVVIISLVLINFLTGRNIWLWYLIAALVVVWICVSVMQIVAFSRRWRY
ncbi:MAG TPA: hypothetical protein VEJ36_06760 [Nitrososphaerales archaeon]|nr:hypothetical protein [Nitrososphaerales archaeon]